MRTQFDDFEAKVSSKFSNIETPGEISRQVYDKNAREVMDACQAMKSKYSELIGILQNALDRVRIMNEAMAKSCADVEIFKNDTFPEYQKEVETKVGRLVPTLKDKIALGSFMVAVAGLAVTGGLFVVKSITDISVRQMETRADATERIVTSQVGALESKIDSIYMALRGGK